MSNSKSETFTVYMYKQEKSFLKWLVLQRQNIETGGDLFGLWQNEDTAIVQLIIGPGKGCSRTQTSFYQDVNYLSSVGEELTTSQGLCNIGEWHSHHRIHLPSPSQGDETTVWNHMGSVSGGRFLLFIASITGSNTNPNVNIGCFMFSSETRIMTKGLLVTLPGGSPIRGHINDVSFKPGPEEGVSWGDFVEALSSGQNNLICAHSAVDKNRLELTQKINQNEGNGKKHNCQDINSPIKDRNFSGSPRKINQGSPPSAPPHVKGAERYHDKIHSTKNATDKSRLKGSTPNRGYGAAHPNERTKDVNKPTKKKTSKKHSELSTSTRGDGVITTQPENQYNRQLRDFTSPIPSSASNDGSKQHSLFDCCNCNKYNKLEEDKQSSR